MKFPVDAHLPPSLSRLLIASGHDSVHTQDLPERNLTPDRALNDLSVQEQRVLISKDSDFYYSHLLHQRPWKLLLVRTGNIGTKDFITLFQRHLPAILDALEGHSLVELDRQSVKGVV
jgi:predicted nuclease of predicted toxin-antitoxin system